MSEAARLVALDYLVKLSAQVEAQLVSQDHEPLKAVLAQAREEAAEAIELLIESTDAADVTSVRRLQNKAVRYGELVNWLARIVQDGKEADVEVSEARAEEMRDLVLDVPEETRTALGIKEPGPGSE